MSRDIRDTATGEPIYQPWEERMTTPTPSDSEAAREKLAYELAQYAVDWWTGNDDSAEVPGQRIAAALASAREEGEAAGRKAEREERKHMDEITWKGSASDGWE